jgi:hypothetical protein
MPWNIDFVEPVHEQIEDVAGIDTFVRVEVRVTVGDDDDDLAPNVEAYVYDHNGPPDDEPPDDATSLPTIGTSSPFTHVATVPIPGGYPSGVTRSTLSRLTLAVWAGRHDGSEETWIIVDTQEIAGHTQDLDHAPRPPVGNRASAKNARKPPRNNRRSAKRAKISPAE